MMRFIAFTAALLLASTTVYAVENQTRFSMSMNYPGCTMVTTKGAFLELTNTCEQPVTLQDVTAAQIPLPDPAKVAPATPPEPPLQSSIRPLDMAMWSIKDGQETEFRAFTLAKENGAPCEEALPKMAEACTSLKLPHGYTVKFSLPPRTLFTILGTSEVPVDHAERRGILDMRGYFYGPAAR